MTQTSDDVIKCNTCKHEFLVLNHDRCPNCGDTNRRVEKAPFIEEVKISNSLSIAQEHVSKRKIVHHFIEAASILISVFSIVFCFFIDPFWGVIVGILIFIGTYYLGKRYAEQWIIEKIIERDHYH